MILPLRMEVQLLTNWCWAAVASAADRYYLGSATGLSQCQVANQHLGTNRCCPKAAECDTAELLEEVLASVSHLNGWGAGWVDEAGVRSEIDLGRPIACRIHWSGAQVGHFVVIVGYSDSGGGLSVTIADSLYGQRTMPYTTFRDDYLGAGRWSDTYFTT